MPDRWPSRACHRSPNGAPGAALGLPPAGDRAVRGRVAVLAARAQTRCERTPIRGQARAGWGQAGELVAERQRRALELGLGTLPRRVALRARHRRRLHGLPPSPAHPSRPPWRPRGHAGADRALRGWAHAALGRARLAARPARCRLPRKRQCPAGPRRHARSGPAAAARPAAQPAGDRGAARPPRQNAAAAAPGARLTSRGRRDVRDRPRGHAPARGHRHAAALAVGLVRDHQRLAGGGGRPLVAARRPARRPPPPDLLRGPALPRGAVPLPEGSRRLLSLPRQRPLRRLRGRASRLGERLRRRRPADRRAAAVGDRQLHGHRRARRAVLPLVRGGPPHERAGQPRRPRRPARRRGALRRARRLGRASATTPSTTSTRARLASGRASPPSTTSRPPGCCCG